MESNSNIDEFISIVKDICLLYQSAVYQELIKDLSTDLNSLLTKKLEYILNNNPTSPFFDNFNKSLLKGIERSREASEGMNNESYIETEVNEILSAQERILTEEDHKATIRKLRSEITDCIQKFQDKKRDLIKAVISRDVEKYNNILEEVGLDKKGLDKKITSRESLDRRCDTLDKMAQSLVLHFSCSLLQAEFLEDGEYSTKLNDITKEISQWYKDHEPEEAQFLPPILHRIFTLCQELSYTCQLIRTQIDTLPPETDEKNIRKHRVFHAPAYILKSEQYAGGVDAIEMLQANNFYDFAKMLITLTRVDISGVINHSTVSSLLLLYKLCSRLIGEKNNNDAQRRPSRSFFPWNGNIEKVFTLIQAKTSLLLVHSFYKPSIDESTGKLDLEKSISIPYSRVENFELLYEGEKYILKGKATPDLSLLCNTGFKEFDNLKPVTLSKINEKKLSDVGKSDIENYNTYIENGRAIRKNLPNQEELKKELIEGKEEFDSQYYPIDVLLSLMRTLEKEYTKKEDELGLDRTKYAEAMGILLKCFSENVQHYKEFVSADQKRALYENSFFTIDNHDDLSIFISSYGCKLFDTDALEHEVYPQYNRLYRKWLSKAQAEAKELTKEAADKASKASQKATIAAEVAQKASNKAAEAAQKASNEAAEAANQASNEAKSTIKEESNQILLHVRRESMSIISVFVALITFISVGISILKGVNNLPDYMILAGTLYVFIASIIGFLYFKKTETPQPTGETPQSKGETPQSTEKQFATRCKHFLKKIVSAKGILFSSIGFAVIMIVIGFSWKNDQKLNPKDVEIQEPFFKQIISTDQHVDPIIDQTSNSQKVQQYSLYADSTHKAPRTEASIPKKTSK